MQTSKGFAPLLGTEFVLSILLSSLPIALSYYISKVDGLEKALSAAIPPDLVFYWTISIGFIGLALIELNHWYFKPSDTAERYWKWICGTSHELAASVISLLRLISGVLIGFVITWAVADWSGYNGKGGTIFLLYAGVGIVEAAFLVWWTKKRQRIPFM
jgi:hypothetical protein